MHRSFLFGSGIFFRYNQHSVPKQDRLFTGLHICGHAAFDLIERPDFNTWVFVNTMPCKEPF